VTPAQVAARLKRRGQVAQARLEAEIREIAADTGAEARTRSPRDTGALARSWRARKGPRGWRIVNDRPRSALVLRGRVYDDAIDLARRLTHARRDRIAKRLKEA
jgi:hypothetical protein